MKKSGLSASVSMLALAVLGAAGSASAQFVNNDGNVCGAITPDPNGGCNVTPALYQDLGSAGVGSFVTITGFFGTYGTAGAESRDLDWYTLTLTEEAVVTVTLSSDSGGDNILFLANTPDCPLVAFYGTQAVGVQTTTQYLVPGTYAIVVTTPFEDADPNTPPLNGCGGYSVSVDIQPGDATCGTGSDQPCDVAHGTPGCDDWACCNQVCVADPLCCAIDWDASCVTNGAVAICGYFIYSCPAGGPVNNCATSPTLVSVGDTVNFNNTTATNDGPSPLVTGAASWMGKDLWYVVQSPGDGQLSVSLCGLTPDTLDTVMELYVLGDSPVVNDPENQLPDGFIGQVDDTCGVTGGPSAVTLVDAAAGEYYLVRLGGWSPDAAGVPTAASGAGTFEVTFTEILYKSAPQKPLIDGTGANVNLGLSSGAISAAAPRRWLATPFTAPSPTSGNAWSVTEIIAKGFTPAGSVNETLNWILWDRNAGNPAPVQADQVATGAVPFPTPFDDPADNAANASHPIAVSGLEIAPGDYYLTVYGANAADFAAGGATPSNFAWFLYNDNGINLIDQQGVFAWRAANYPAPGFVRYTIAGYTVQPGDDQNDIYNVSYEILGDGIDVGNPCPADLNLDGAVNAADLTILLAAWGTPDADLNGDGTTNAADLTILLAAWGACP
jgi:hypothetical protein